jgi:hypothetical protein
MPAPPGKDAGSKVWLCHIEIRGRSLAVIGARRFGCNVRGRPTRLQGMCRNIRPLYNFEPPATAEEVRDAALQYVRKISGFTKPSAANAEAFACAVAAVEQASAQLLGELVTNAPQKNREIEAAKARARRAAREAA